MNPKKKLTKEERIKELFEKGEVLPASNDYIYKALKKEKFFLQVMIIFIKLL